MRGEFYGALDAQGLKSGAGRYLYPNRFFAFEGQFLADAKHGQGRLALGEAGSYTGSFADGEITGRGELTLPTGLSYTGDFLRGERHGQGALRTSALAYTGGFAHGRFEGAGRLERFAEDRVYRGAFRAGEATGEFEVSAASSGALLFRGRLSRGRRHGPGTAVLGRWLLSADFAEDLPGEQVTLQLQGAAFSYAGPFAGGRPLNAASAFRAELLEAEEKPGERGAKPAARARLESACVYRLLLSCLYQPAERPNPEYDPADKKKAKAPETVTPEPALAEGESGRLFSYFFVEEFGEKRSLRLNLADLHLESLEQAATGEPHVLVTQKGVACADNFYIDGSLLPGNYTLMLEDVTEFEGEWFCPLPALALKVEIAAAKKAKK